MKAPFKVGQKVVCINPNKEGSIIKGAHYEIVNVVKSQCDCHGWEVQVYGVYGFNTGSRCDKCGVKISYGGLLYFDSRRFAPIEEAKERIRYVAVSETLREKAVEVAAIETN